MLLTKVQAIMVPRPIWSILENIWEGLGPLIWEEIENGQTVHKPKLKYIGWTIKFVGWGPIIIAEI
jgi:hypothetical protein